MPFTIVRHAHAGTRSTWAGDDRLRPLSEKGRVQAEQVAAYVAARAPARLVSSPALRCRETLLPLGRELDLTIEVDDRLFEGPREPWLADLVIEAATDDDLVVCTHGDVIPVLLNLLIDDGLPAPRQMHWHKGSVWTIERRDDHWVSSDYWRPDG